jgi:PAS domain S-box-containing protein
MLDFFRQLLAVDFMPHGYCYMWNPEILWLHILSDLLIALSYYSIPVGLIIFVRKRTDLNSFKSVFWLFILFIFFCGTTHVLSIYTIWTPAYRLSGFIKAITAVVSLVTAVLLWPMIPRALQIPSQKDLAKLNEQLQQEILKKEAYEQELLENQAKLESIVQERTKDLERTNEKLLAQIEENKTSQAQIYFQASLLNQVQNAVIAIDKKYKIIYWNRFAEETFGWSEQEALGKSPTELYLRAETEPVITDDFEKEMYVQPKWENEFDCLTKDEEIIPTYFVSSSIKDENQSITGFVTIAFDLREQKKLENELRAAKDKAEESVKAKQDFLSTMSHEIRTPLNAVIGFSELLLLEDPKPEQVQSLQTLKFAGENLLGLINDILDFHKIEAHKLVLEETPFSIKILIDRLAQLYRPLAKEKNLSLETYLDPRLPKKVLGDALRLSQILTNLISNAIKFTKEGSVVLSVFIEQETDTHYQIQFEVEDTGIGIPIDKQALIFESFQQANSDTTRKFGGTGLGLTITQKLIELHQSEIKLESYQEKGSKFYFTLSFLKNNQTRSTKNLETIYNTNLPDEKHSTQKLILVVEDNAINQIITGRFLEMWGLEVVFAENGKIALEMLEDTSIQKNLALIFMDIYMPEMDGYTTTENIRKMKVFDNIPIIALTASIIESSKPKIAAVGMNDYLTKPFKSEDLKKMLLKYHIPVSK